MAKKSMIEREKKREEIVAKYADKRQALLNSSIMPLLNARRWSYIGKFNDYRVTAPVPASGTAAGLLVVLEVFTATLVFLVTCSENGLTMDFCLVS
jgi:hypothetical protein